MAHIDFYDGTSAHTHQAQVFVQQNTLIVHAQGMSYTFASEHVEPTLSTPNGRRFIHLPNNMALEFHDNHDAELILNQLNTSHLKAVRWFDRNYRTKRFLFGALAVFIALITSLYFFVLPMLSNKIANQIPPSVFEQMSSNAITQLVDSETLLPSKLSKKRREQLLTQFNQLKKPEGDVPFKLHFYSAPQIGPNAFALPSGDVVLLDELVNVAKNDSQIMGVLSHELGHVALRHTARSMVQTGIVSFAMAAWLGDYGSTLANLSAATVFNQKYSRDFERESDDYAIKIMLLNKINPAVLADFFVLMEQNETDENKKPDSKNTQKQQGSTVLLDMIRSHPPTDERVQTLRNAAHIF